MMDGKRRKALEAAGFRFGDAADFLELSEDERMLVELRVKLAQAIRRRREQSNLSQKQVATRIKSTQPRVARIEAAAADVSLDQMFRGLFAVGGNVEDLSAPSPSGREVPRVRVSVKTATPPTASQSPGGPAELPAPRIKGKKPGTPVGA
jgi:predicted XRE-type DNA-binding protein